MTILFADGCDHYATADIFTKYDFSYAFTQWSITANNPRRIGTTSLYCPASSSYYIGKLIPDTQTVYIGFAYQGIGAAWSDKYFIGLLSASWQIRIFITAGCGFGLNRGNGGTRIWTSPDTGYIELNTWQYLEFKFTVSNTVGGMEFRRNGIPIISSGFELDTLEHTAWDAIGVVFFPNDGMAGNYYKDIYISDSGYLGNIRIDKLLPNGIGTYSLWTPSAGNNYENVDNATPDDDTTYNETNIVDKKDTYTFENLDDLGGPPIYAVVSNISARKTDAGLINLAPLQYINTSDYLGSTLNFSENYKIKQIIMEVNPDDSASWEDADVNGMESGMQSTVVTTTTTSTTTTTTT